MTGPWFALLAGGTAVVVTRPWWAPPRRRPGPVEAGGRHERRARPSRRLLLAGVALVAGVGLVGPVPVAAVVVSVAGVRFRRRRASVPAAEQAVAAGLPEVADLVRLGVAAGLTPRAALERTRGLLPEPFGAAADEVIRRAAAGEPLAVALDRLTVELGPAVQPLVSVLATGARGGGAVAAALQRVGDESRNRRRVAAQERARRLPVTMLLPLVLCVLPAFVLIGVVPLVLASLRDLGLG